MCSSDLKQLLTPVTEVRWLAATDTVRDAFDHMETYDLKAAPVVAWNGRYLGTVTEADLRRHVTGVADRAAALESRVSEIERRSHTPVVALDRDVASIGEPASAFVAVVDELERLVGIVERRKLHTLPSAA